MMFASGLLPPGAGELGREGGAAIDVVGERTLGSFADIFEPAN